MKKIFQLIIIFLFPFIGSAQSVAKIDTGSIKNAKYRILFPKNWKGKLVMYAHGYEFMGSPKQSTIAEFDKMMSPFLERDFAVAASDYQYQGFALAQGVDDTEALRKYFYAKYGKPDSTFMVGHSMGGGISIATMENFGVHYKGALPLCPLSSRPYLQCRNAFDIYATFNGLFPGIVTSLKDIFDLSKPSPNSGNMFAKVNDYKAAIFAKDSILAMAFAKKFDLKIEDLPIALIFHENILRDLVQKTGGNPFDNTNTLYSGFPNDLEVNQKAERVAATTNPDKFFDKYDRTGNINKPILLMHTLYDQLIPPTFGEVNLENMVHKQGKDQYFTVKYTNGQGHCQFTQQQTGKAFDEQRTWVKTGIKAKAGYLE